MKTITKRGYTSLALIALGCFPLSPTTQAVSPPPDGGYPGGNTAEGQNTLLNLTTGGFNTAVGFLSLRADSTNSFNTAIGAGTLLASTADQNTATGAGALLSNTTGFQNTANGAFGLFNNTTGSRNAAIGYGALQANLSGNVDTAIGSFAGEAVTTASYVICIGDPGQNVDHSCFIGSIRGVTTQNGDAIPVLIDSNNQLGTASSSRRYKTDIKPLDKASESVLALKPVSFRYKLRKNMTPQFGLIAEDVAKVNPNLVIYDSDGEPYTVRYDAVNAMLLNEFLKEHRRVQHLEATAAKQQKQIEALTAGLQKVSARLEVQGPVLQNVVNNH
jgi:endosialidase-like protein